MLLTPFQQRTETAAGGNVHGLQLVDYDNDGVRDLVGLIDASNTGSSAALYSWHGLGDGTFDTPVSLGVSQVADLIVADVNNDGKKDLVMSTWDNKLVVMLGNGSGFDAPKTKTLDHYEVHISAVSFDGDAYVDVVGAAIGNDFFVVYHGNGDGTFTEIKRVSTGSIEPYAIAAADFDGDGRTDVAYSDYAYSGTVLVAFQNADGTFGSPVILQSGQTTGPNNALRDFPATLTVGDVDENGKPDLIATNWQDAGPTDSVVIFRNNGSRSFTRSVLVPGPMVRSGDFESLRLLDINGDGHLDIVAAAVNSGTIMTFIGNGDGTFLSPTYLDGNINSIAVGPIGNDGSVGVAAGLYQTFMAAKYSCTAQVYAFSVSPVVRPHRFGLWCPASARTPSCPTERSRSTMARMPSERQTSTTRVRPRSTSAASRSARTPSPRTSAETPRFPRRRRTRSPKPSRRPPRPRPSPLRRRRSLTGLTSRSMSVSAVPWRAR